MKQEILQSARVAELRASADELAVLCKPPAAVALPRAPSWTASRRLFPLMLALLARERRRSGKLVDLLKE